MDSFVTSSKNDMFSYYRGIDLKELIMEIENYDLVYRSTLDLPEDVTFGLEIEYEFLSRKLVAQFLKNEQFSWCDTYDETVPSGGEIVSPILGDNLKTWDILKIIYNYLNEQEANMDINAGGHIHVGAHLLGVSVSNWRQFFKLIIAYESVFYRFFNGDKLKARNNILRYAYPLSDALYQELNFINSARKLSDIKEVLLNDTYRFVNFKNVKFKSIKSTKFKNTVEFRSPNATKEIVVAQNNVNAATKAVLAPTKGLIDEDFLNYKINQERISLQDFNLYNVINIKSALELVDLIFDNNLDKVYFLRQYFKCFVDYNGLEKRVRKVRFIK